MDLTSEIKPAKPYWLFFTNFTSLHKKKLDSPNPKTGVSELLWVKFKKAANNSVYMYEVMLQLHF